MLYFICLLVVSSIACWTINYIPMLNIAAGIIWGIALLTGGYLVSFVSLMAIFILNSLLLFGLSGSSNFFFWAVYGIPSLIMGLLLTRQKGYYELQKWGMIAATLVVCLYMGALYSPSGFHMLSDIQTQITEKIQQSGSLQDPEMIEIYEQQGINSEELKRSAQEISIWLIKHLPSMYLVQTLFIMQIILLVGAYGFKKNGMPILQHRPFREEIMPWQLAWVVIIGLALWLWGRNELSIIYYVGSNLLLVMATIAAYYGIADVAFWWHRLSYLNRRVLLPVLFIGMIILFLPALFFIALLGLFDSLFDYRNLYRKKEES